MPKVPTYDGPQVQEQATQGGYQQNIDVTQGARALARGLGDVAQVADAIDYRDSQAAAFKAESDIREKWGEQQAALRGQYKKDQADQYKAAADEWWAKAKTEYTKELSPRAQALAGKSIGSYKLAQDADTTAYVTREKTAAREINFRTLQNKLITDASAMVTPANAAAVSETTANQIRSNAIKYAAAEGLSSDVGEDMARDQLNKYHTAVALMLSGRPDGKTTATEYLNQFGADIPLDARERVNDQIELTAERAKTKQGEDAFGNLRLSLLQGATPTRTQVEDLRKIDPNKAATLQAMINAEKKARQVEAGGGSIKTDQRAYFELRDRVLAGENVDPLAYRDRVSRSDLEEAKKLQEKVRNPTEQKREFSAERTIDGYRPTSLKKDSEEWSNLRRTMEDTVIAARASKGKDLTDKEMRDIIDPLFVSGTIKKNWWPDTTKKRYEMTPAELAEAEFPGAAPKAASKASPARNITTIYQVSGADRALITKALKSEGIIVTEENIQARYGMVKGSK